MFTSHYLVKARRSRKFWIFGSLAVLVVIAGLVLWHMSTHNTSPSTGGQTAYNNAKKQAVVNNGGQPVSDNGKGATPSGTYTPPTTNNGITMIPSQSKNSVTIATKLVGYSDGTCNLTVINGSNSTTQTAQVIFAPDYSSCAGFSVPISSLGNGTWSITLNVSTDGNTTSKTITYKVSE